MLFKVMKRYAKGSDIPVAQFTEERDARLLIQAKLAEDARLKVNVTYRLLEGVELLEEFTQTGETSSPTGGQGPQRSSSQSFQPTPFNTAPRPGGLPQNWVKDKDTGEKK